MYILFIKVVKMFDLSLQVADYNWIRLAQFLVAAFLSWRFSAFHCFSVPLFISAQIATRIYTARTTKAFSGTLDPGMIYVAHV